MARGRYEHVGDHYCYFDCGAGGTKSRRAPRTLQATGISKEQAEVIGWTKLQIIARHLQEDDPSPFTLDELLELASDHKVRDLPAALRGKKIIPKRGVMFNLSLNARVELNRTLVQYGAKEVPKGLIGREAALMSIVRAAKANKKTNG